MKLENKQLEREVLVTLSKLESEKKRLKYILLLDEGCFTQKIAKDIFKEYVKDPALSWAELPTTLKVDASTVVDWQVISNELFTSAQMNRAIESLKELSARRKLEGVAKKIVSGLELSFDPNLLVQDAQMGINNVIQRIAKQSGNILEAHEAYERDRQNTKFIAFPWPTLNVLVKGLRPGQTHIMGGEPGSGKSYAVQNIAMKAALQNKSVLFFSLELQQSVNFDRMAHLMQSYCKLDNIETAITQLKEMSNLMIYDQIIDFEAIVLEIKRQKILGNVDLVILDHLQDLSLPDKDTQYEAITKVAGAMKNLAIELEIPIILVSQLNRAPVGRTKGAITQNRFLGSGKIEQVAHAAYIITTELDKDGDHTNRRFIQVVKNRGIPGERTGTGTMFGQFNSDMELQELDVRENFDDMAE